MLLCSCKHKEQNPNKYLHLESFSGLRAPQYALNKAAIRRQLDILVKTDADSMLPDYHAKRYYACKKSFLWIQRYGVDSRVDTLLSYLCKVNEIGFAPNKFCVNAISADLKRLRNLQFDKNNNTINKVAARLEYHLTKAFLRYATGQRFGYTNPYALFNKLDIRQHDSLSTTYHRLFDIEVSRPNKYYWAHIWQKTHRDSLTNYLHAVQPQSKLYKILVAHYQNLNHKGNKIKALCNIERARWRLANQPYMYSKYALVNIPSMQLVAIDGQKVLKMKIGVGTPETKTPLLTSSIKRMDINPQWIIPKSIIEKSIAMHAGDSIYFDRHRYFIRERSTGKSINVKHVSSTMLRSGNYFVIQEGGKGNAMGRIVFRFDNKFAVYLHDTSSKKVFEQSNRVVSHGCIRIEKPFDFAVFLLAQKDEETIEKIQYSMAADIHSKYKQSSSTASTLLCDTLNTSKLINSITVQPTVPLFITYYTLYPDEHQTIKTYCDIYGFDAIIYNLLRNYIH